jgi:hypothetical protein
MSSIDQMKRFFPNTLALLLVIGGLGHVFAATLCPRSPGRECCFANTSNHTHDSLPSHQDMAEHCMPMDSMSMDDMAMDDTVAVEVPNPFAPAVVFEEVSASRFEQPVEFCAHCMMHSGLSNGPASVVTGPDESRKAVDSVPLPVSSFLAPSLTTVTRNGSPGEHAPPGPVAPRHILISVFLI